MRNRPGKHVQDEHTHHNQDQSNYGCRIQCLAKEQPRDQRNQGYALIDPLILRAFSRQLGAIVTRRMFAVEQED
jgi:hypothetical protein